MGLPFKGNRAKGTVILRVGFRLKREGLTSKENPGLFQICKAICLHSGIPLPSEKDKHTQWQIVFDFDATAARNDSRAYDDAEKTNHKIQITTAAKRAARMEFYSSPEWRAVRYAALKLHGGKCQCCGRSPKKHGVVLHVDHIKPRSKHPELELSISNLQVLCEDCNLGKSGNDQTDWR